MEWNVIYKEWPDRSALRHRLGKQESIIPSGQREAGRWDPNRIGVASFSTSYQSRCSFFFLPKSFSGMLKVRSEKSLGFNVCRIVPYRHAGGDYLLLCGSNRQCQLFSCEGYPLGSVADCNKWVWATAAKPNSTIVVDNARAQQPITIFLLFNSLFCFVFS